MGAYGKELVLDIHNCNPATFTRSSIRRFFRDLCLLIDMERAKLCWWDEYNTAPEDMVTEPHLKGTSAVQFIMTSNIVVHTLDLLGCVYLNIFSCKDFDAHEALVFSEKWFRGSVVNFYVLERL